MAEAGGGLGLEETELRLGLPGGDGAGAWKSSGKRAFAGAIDLKLKLPVAGGVEVGAQAIAEEKLKKSVSQKDMFACAGIAAGNETPPAPKAQVVGWPPVRSFRKNILSQGSKLEKKEKTGGSTAAALVKVSVDGAPYLRKVDLKLYKSYQELSTALENMFSSFTGGSCGSEGINGRDFMNESKLMDLLNGSEYVPTYEDKDGDWMLVGDVPWEMFVDSCNRLRIMKGSEAIGFAPRATEKCRKRG